MGRVLCKEKHESMAMSGTPWSSSAFRQLNNPAPMRYKKRQVGLSVHALLRFSFAPTTVFLYFLYFRLLLLLFFVYSVPRIYPFCHWGRMGLLPATCIDCKTKGLVVLCCVVRECNHYSLTRSNFVTIDRCTPSNTGTSTGF